jgi:clan AA aspartic protease (TIGR02281 family)
MAGLIIVTIASSAHVSLAAAGGPEDPESAFNSAGLKRMGFVLILPDEREVHDQLDKSRQLKSVVAGEISSRSSFKREYDSAFHDYNQLAKQLTDMEAQMQQVKNDPQRWNRLVDPHNQTVAQLKLRQSQMTELEGKLKQVHDSSDAWRESVLTTLQQAQQTTAKYGALAKDDKIKSAIDRHNAATAPNVVLGPSGQFKQDLEALRKIVNDTAAEGVSADMRNGTPVVRVTINGVTTPMIWDSGASDVAVSAETADRLGIHLPADAPTAKGKMADGSIIETKIVILPSVSVGVFNATNVRCSVFPRNARTSADLLGGTFQEHFVCRMDQSAQVIHLTPKDKSASIGGLVDASVQPEPAVRAHGASAAVVEATGPFAAWNLNIAKSLLVLPQESPVRTATLNVHRLRTILESEMNSRAGVNRAIDSAMAEIERLSGRLDDLEKQTNPAARNQLVAPHNEALRAVDQQLAKIQDLRKRLANVQDSQSDFVNAVDAAVKLADPARRQYDVLAKDPGLAAAVAAYNAKTADTVKIGPSGEFASDFRFLNQCVDEFMAEGIPARMGHGTPQVEVTINGKKIAMTWDSGATFVSLSAETAEVLGIHATDKDPKIELTIADGSKVLSTLVTLPSVSVGPFTAKNVKCVIDPKGPRRSPDLLGGTFQQHFLCRVDQQAEVIHLTPSDRSASVSKASNNDSRRQTTGNN